MVSSPYHHTSQYSKPEMGPLGQTSSFTSPSTTAIPHGYNKDSFDSHKPIYNTNANTTAPITTGITHDYNTLFGFHRPTSNTNTTTPTATSYKDSFDSHRPTSNTGISLSGFQYNTGSTSTQYKDIPPLMRNSPSLPETNIAPNNSIVKPDLLKNDEDAKLLSASTLTLLLDKLSHDLEIQKKTHSKCTKVAETTDKFLDDLSELLIDYITQLNEICSINRKASTELDTLYRRMDQLEATTDVLSNNMFSSSESDPTTEIANGIDEKIKKQSGIELVASSTLMNSIQQEKLSHDKLLRLRPFVIIEATEKLFNAYKSIDKIVVNQLEIVSPNPMTTLTNMDKNLTTIINNLNNDIASFEQLNSLLDNSVLEE